MDSSTADKALSLTEKTLIEYGLIGVILLILLLLSAALFVYIWKNKPEDEDRNFDFMTQLLQHASINSQTQKDVKDLLEQQNVNNERVTNLIGILTQNLGNQMILIREIKEQDQLSSKALISQTELINSVLVTLTSLSERLTALEGDKNQGDKIYKTIIEIQKAMILPAPEK